MSNAYFKAITLGQVLQELPKSTFPASFALENGNYPFYCSSANVKYINTFTHDKPTVFMGTGGLASVNYSKDKFAYSTDTWAFRSSDDEEISSKYIYRALQQKLPEIDYRAFEGSGLKHLRKGYVKKLKLRVPADKLVRLKIEAILDVADDAIEKTEALIEKYQQIKAGLMHDLFTRGIGADGKLRPPQEEAPELYQLTPLGWLPKDWEILDLQDEASISHGFAFSGGGFFDEPPGDVLLTPGNFHRDGGLYFTEANTKYFRGFVPSETILSRGDLVTVMTDLSPQTLILGRFAVINAEFSVLHNQRIGLVKCKKSNQWDIHYLVNALNNEQIRRNIIIGATGTTVRHTSPARILSLSIARPKIVEQRMVADKIYSIQKKLDIEIYYLEKLTKQKSGLMHDLLTGKVQVPLNSPEAAHV